MDLIFHNRRDLARVCADTHLSASRFRKKPLKPRRPIRRGRRVASSQAHRPMFPSPLRRAICIASRTDSRTAPPWSRSRSSPRGMS
jgi:hypothetical protein